jgi:HD-GYP domain-containing protein (c-di-GMP phosphodiesterase class II)
MDTPKLRDQFLNHNLKILRRPTPKQDSSPYLPVFIEALMVEERLTFPIYLKVSDGEDGDIKFLPYLEEGEILQRAWVESLQRVGIERLYFHETDMERVIAYLNNHLLLAGEEPNQHRERLTILREHLGLSLHRAFQNPHLGSHLKVAKKSLGNLAKMMGQEGFPWKLIWELLFRDYTLYNHSVNVGIMGLAFMAYLKKPSRDCLAMGLAGLFHDLGLTCLSEEITGKVEKLNPGEWENLRKHPSLGYKLLKNNPQIPVETLRLILEHHESADGNGYPQGLGLSQQHPHTRVLFVLEAYDGLTTFRPYRPAHTPFAALKILQEQQSAQGLACEALTLKKFIQFLALA